MGGQGRAQCAVGGLRGEGDGHIQPVGARRRQTILKTDGARWGEGRLETARKVISGNTKATRFWHLQSPVPPLFHPLSFLHTYIYPIPSVRPQ